jgi:hypothetical protein
MDKGSEKRVRWARGFFRAWVVIALLWAAFASFVAYDSFPSEAKPWFRAEHDGQWLTKTELLDAADSARLAGDSATGDKLVGLAMTIDRQISEARLNAAFQWFLAVTLPPMVLLALGALVGWVARGFQRDLA